MKLTFIKYSFQANKQNRKLLPSFCGSLDLGALMAYHPVVCYWGRVKGTTAEKWKGTTSIHILKHHVVVDYGDLVQCQLYCNNY